MLVNEEDFDALVEAVDNSQMRLADTFMLRVLAQLIDSVEEISERVNLMYEFLSSDEENKEQATEKVELEKNEAKTTAQNAEEDQSQKTVSKSKKTEETKAEIQSEK